MPARRGTYGGARRARRAQRRSRRLSRTFPRGQTIHCMSRSRLRALRIVWFLVTSLPPLAAFRLFPVTLAGSLVFALATACGGDGTPAPESAHGAAHKAS